MPVRQRQPRQLQLQEATAALGGPETNLISWRRPPRRIEWLLLAASQLVANSNFAERLCLGQTNHHERPSVKERLAAAAARLRLAAQRRGQLVWLRQEGASTT